MKQSLFVKKISALFSGLDLNCSYDLDGFHPDFFLSLYGALNVPALILIPDNLFNSVLKYLSSLQEDRLVVFIPPSDLGDVGPAGFVQETSIQIHRSRELLSNGLGSVSFIVCSESGFLIPMVNGGCDDKLNFSSPVSFDDCCGFLSLNNYRCVDVVLGPGDFCIRGGIIDVFPFSSRDPVRISFLDSVVDIHKFDVQSQLTTAKLKKFSLTAPLSRGLLPLKKCSLSGFLLLFYCVEKSIHKTISASVGFSGSLTCVSYKEFIRLGGLDFKDICVDETLSSVGVVDFSNNFIVPPWFVNALPLPLVHISSEDDNYIPLNISNINKGDYLVHRDHGIGVCLGLQKYNSGGSVQEFLSIKYEDGGVIRLDSAHLDLVDYYASGDTDGVCLDSLQKRAAWSRKRMSAYRHAEETIEHLLNLYVRRNDISRPAFVPYNDMENQFINDFPYKETADQISAWKEISNDLSSSAPMDRLLCGDVGFGKTEIALRAAFRVVLGGRRVLVLAPTTILANQLFVSFHSRLGPHAVGVEIVSRFRTTKQIKVIREKIISGENDILIGTHAILNNGIYLKNIGLLVIDEEHRFGVEQKEKIKGFKEGVDVLSMSATPIPRSLNLALSGIYSISLLQTPPIMRLPIITIVDYFSDRLIQDAVDFEVTRGGQVYFVHNNIQSIEHITKRLKGLFPKLHIMFIHGQEPARDVENKMHRFVSGVVNVLVCTSIIEAGIDVPNANCIIINNSHLFGLSQLYQIRGRVGRSNRQAYAHLLVPRRINLSDAAFRRIKTIEENIRLGSGYNISRSDMALRGSGSLFGYKQSGGSGSVGYEMYLRLIRRTLHDSGRLKTDFFVLPEDVLIEVFKHRHIPEDYISIDVLRLSFYKSLSSAVDNSEIDNILYHLTNRFGPPPASVINLIHEYRLRLLAAIAGVRSIQIRGCGVVCKIIKNDNPEIISSFLEYIDRFWSECGVDFHLLPVSETNLSICIHISNNSDKYSLLSSFLDKFKA